MRVPKVRYARTTEGVHIAYQVVGEGPIDLLFVPGYASNLQWQWELPSYARFLERLASFSRLICVDRRGAGLSDRFSPRDLPPLEDLAKDLEIVLDAIGSERAVVFGLEDGGAIGCMLAATRPERMSALILYAMHSRGIREEGEAFWEEIFRRVDASWGTLEYALWDTGLANPSRVDDPGLVEWLVAHQRLSASPASATALLRIYRDTDLRGLLPAITVPTMIIHRLDDRLTPISESRVVADAISGSKLVELAGDDHYWVVGNDDIAEEVEEFLTGVRPQPDADRVLTTVLFTDIVGSTQRASELGDREWKALLERHDELLRREVHRLDGREVDTAGDGFFATFDGPARAVRCARAVGDAIRVLGLEIRAGCHTGEVELRGDNLAGIAVHIGARISALARPSEVLVSSTVKDLVAGSGLAFDDAGEHDLKGVPDRWRLYRVVSGQA